MIPVDGRLSFDELLLRVHPAASRVRTLVAAHRARLVVFDLLVDERGRSLVEAVAGRARGRGSRRSRRSTCIDAKSIVLSRATRRLATARGWLERGGDGDLDGVVAKRLDLPYRSGERDGMVKVKRQRTADCVVGGFRYASKGRTVGSLLLGLYDDEGLLNHVGFCSSLSAAERKGLTARLETLRRAAGFHGTRARRAEPLEHRAYRGVGAARRRSWSSKWGTITCRGAGSVMAPGSCAGGRTRRRRSAGWSRSPR